MWLVYLFSICEGLKSVVIALTVAFFILAFIALVAWRIMSEDAVDEEDRERALRFKSSFNKAMVVACIFSIFAITVPSKRVLAEMITVGTVVDYARNSDTVKKIPDKVVNLAVDYLDKLDEKVNGRDTTNVK